MASGRTIVVPGNGIAKVAKRFKLKPGYSVAEFVMRELDGNDDLSVHGWLDAKLSKEEKSDPDRLSQARAMERVRRSLVSVDGDPVNVDAPYGDMDDWSQRTLSFAIAAFHSMHSVKEKEIEDFLAASEDVELQPRARRTGRNPSDDESTDD